MRNQTKCSLFTNINNSLPNGFLLNRAPGQAEDPERQAAADPRPVLAGLGQPLRDGVEAARRPAREDALRPQVRPPRGPVAPRQGKEDALIT